MELLPKLSQNLLEILNDDEYYDITIEVGNDPYKNDETLVNIKLSNILPEIFQIILRYIYGGKLSLEECDTLDIIKILMAASELSLQELIPHLQSFLINNKASWMEQNFSLIYQTSFENDSFLELQKFCTELMSKEPEKIFNSPDFTSITEKTLITLIQNDTQIDEVQIWEHVLKWGIAQNPELSSDPTCYSNDDFVTLKNTLEKCIPFIKFIRFTSKEFLNKVYPYKLVISEKLYENLIKWFLNNDYDPSNKLELQEIKEISCKMNGNDYNPNSNLKLQIVEEINHEINNYYDSSSNNEILGGYNPIKWESIDGYGSTGDSFIFSFMNKNINDHVISRVKENKHAIHYWNRYGPSFGRGDLTIYGGMEDGCNFYDNSNNYCSRRSYERNIREIEIPFHVEEYEVFQIRKKF
ncbi:BTB/POZ protein [Rhizophagus irregularis DAOM 181602=DAOM 197198]|nr:BTB/POZ protein [Rhizophagus irregularis DAOM 181602=DAOM 197198]